jgi:KipI family sensor histidine kinase inhibitor
MTDLQPLGEAGLLVRWSDRAPSGQLARQVRAVWESLRRVAPKAVVDIVPGPGSLLLRFDPLRLPRASLEAVVRDALSVHPAPPRARAHRVAVRYGGEHGPDLDEVARRTGLDPASVVSLHTSRVYHVLSTGFMPGFVYLGPLHTRLRLPRREQPRRQVPSGSIALGAAQTGIYGVTSAGGWWLIGRATIAPFDSSQDPPSNFSIGDAVRFQMA